MIITTDYISVINDVLTIAKDNKVALHNRATNIWEIGEWNEFESINWDQIDGVMVAFEDDLVYYPIEKAKQIITCKEHVDLFIQDKWSNWIITHVDDREIIFCKVKGNKKHIMHRQWDEDIGLVWTEFYIVEPEESSLNVVLDEDIHPRHERVTPMEEEEEYEDE